MADRGELMSVRLGQNITRSLRIEIENAAPGRGDMKALVERRFGIVPAKFRQFTPGYVQQDFGERGTEDYRLSAGLNLHEFTQLVIYAVLEHNFEPIGGFRLPAEMVTDKLEPAPIDLWTWGIRHRSGALRVLTVEEVQLNVMPMEKATVTPHGIHFKGGYYSSPTALRDDWFALARRETREVQVSFDPRSMQTVYLRDAKFPGGFEVCKPLPRSAEYAGKTLYEIEELGDAQAKVVAAGENSRQEKRILIDSRMADIQAKARKATKAVADPSVSKSKRVADIRDNKAREKEVQRGDESFILRPEPPRRHSETAATPAQDTGASQHTKNTLTLLQEHRAQRQGGRND